MVLHLIKELEVHFQFLQNRASLCPVDQENMLFGNYTKDKSVQQFNQASTQLKKMLTSFEFLVSQKQYSRVPGPASSLFFKSIG